MMSTPNQFQFKSYVGMHQNELRSKPSIHSLSKLQQLDQDLEGISQSLAQGTHPVDLLALQNGVLDKFVTSMVTKEDEVRIAQVNNDPGRYSELYNKVQKQGFKSETDAERSVKRHKLADMSAGHVLHKLFQDWFSAFSSKQEVYKAKNNRLYPIRDTKGTPIYIKYWQGKMCISDMSNVGIDQCKSPYPSEQVKPFLNPFLTEDERAALYDQLSVITLPDKPEELKNSLETGLCGQNEVVASKFIPKGTCIGVYGGRLFDGNKVFRNISPNIFDLVSRIDTYFMAISENGLNGSVIDGDNILSRINTIFRYKHGKPVRQAPVSAYNTERVDFEADLVNGMKIRIPTLFTTKDIQPGTALRYNYELTPQQIKDRYH